MGHPRKITKKYSTPKHPWRAERILEEKGLEKKYGLKNKREIWKAHAAVRGVRSQARSLLALKTAQAEIEKAQLIGRLVRLGLLKPSAGLDEMLALKTTDLLDRRLQTIVFKSGHASTIGQARQFIIHGHVTVKDRKVTVPSYLVRVEEENKIALIREFNMAAPKEVKEAEPSE